MHFNDKEFFRALRGMISGLGFLAPRQSLQTADGSAKIDQMICLCWGNDGSVPNMNAKDSFS